MRRVVTASLFGTALETYDIYLYGTAAAIIFAPLFFPGGDPATAALLSIASFGISFVARPLGAVVFGHYGDRIGRKRMLYLTLLLMGVSTALIGLLPTYAAAGMWAPVLLCLLRFVQGFAFAGEYSGSVLVLLENAPARERGFYAGLNNIGPVFGFVASAGFFLALTSSMSGPSFQSWGWRIPFLASVLLVAVGLYVRRCLPETAVFEKEVGSRSARRGALPIVRLLRRHPRQLLLASGANICHFATFYVFTVFALAYGKGQLGLGNGFVLSIVIVAVCSHLVAIPYASSLSDRVGRRPVLVAGFVAIIGATFLFWTLFPTRSWGLMLLGSLTLMTAYSFVYGPLASFTTETFETSVRYTGGALAYNIGGILGGGLAPVVATLLMQTYGHPYAIAVYIAVLGVISLGCVVAAGRTEKLDLFSDRQ
jgi:MFS family permease